MDLQPIRTDEDYSAALREIERLWGADPASADGAKLDALVTLVDAYDQKHWVGIELDPIQHLQEHMRSNGYGQTDLATLFGSRSRASEVLSRKRPLTLDMIQKLRSEWGIPAELLIKPYKLAA